MNRNKIIKLLIFVLIIIIVIISSLLIVVNNQHSSRNVSYIQNEEENNSSLHIDTVEDEKYYFVLKQAIEKFYKNCTKMNASEKDISQYRAKLNEQEWNEYKDILLKEEQDEAKKIILAILDSNYINEYNITKDNIKNKFGINNQVDIVIDNFINIDFFYSENLLSYLVKGYCIDVETKGSKAFELIVNLDKLNNTYSICAKEYFESDNSLNEKNLIKIENSSYNVFENKEIEESEIAYEYFYNYKYNMLYNTEKAYYSLDEPYRDERFGTLENYKKYIKDNNNDLVNSTLTKYQIENLESSKKYICLDNFENYYVFEQKKIGVYVAMMDTYTIESDKFKKAYEEGNNQRKVKLNIDKFIKMINNKDYQHAYEVLDDNFKNNYFKSEENFKKYIKNNFLEYSNIEFENYKEEGEIFIYQIVLSDKLSKSDKKLRMNIIMKLKEGTDFVMSFGAVD